MKTMKFLTVTLLLFILSNASAAISTQERTKSFKVTKGDNLIVNVDPGDITIDTWSKSEVFIKVKGLEDEDLGNLKMYQSGGTVTVEFESEWGWSDELEFQITTPDEFNLELSSTGGNIRVEDNIKGVVEASTQGGNVTLQNVDGNTKVHTSGGNINTGDINGTLKLNTMGGNITVGNVKGGKANLSTMGGNIHVADAGSDVVVKTYGGNIVIGNVGGSADATTFGGNIILKNVSGSASMNTFGGNLVLESATGKVKADTKGGNISLKDVRGSIDANTSGGNIYAELIPSGKGRSNISTAGGDIELRIPANSKATIEAVIEIQGWWDDESDAYEIQSDFEATAYKTNKDEDEIYAKYVLNGGGEEIRLETVNSDIKIKKLNK